MSRLKGYNEQMQLVQTHLYISSNNEIEFGF